MADPGYIEFDRAGLEQLFASVEGPAGKHLTRLAIKIERAAKKSMTPGGTGTTHVPSSPGQPPAVDTGRLRASITHEVGRDSGGLVAKVGTNVTYAAHLELGTSKMAARPFLRPALNTVVGP